jgi:hypothetical protein
MNDYDSLITSIPTGKGYDHILDAQVEVADTMLTCLTWWESHGGDLKPAPSDILAMALAVLARADTIKARRDHEAEALMAEDAM